MNAEEDVPVDLDTVADELYGLPAEEFTAARTAAEKEARAAGEKELAAQIHTLAKPNQVAWLANQLARHHADELRPLLELGAGLRDAAGGLTGDQLREFTRQKRQLVRALVQRGRGLASRAGRKVSADAARGLEETLDAGLVDPGAAERLLAGRLSSGLQHAGFGPAIVGGGPALSSVPTGRTAASAPGRSGTRDQRLAARVAAADREVADARSAVDRATRAKSDADAAVELAAKECREAEDKVARLKAKLERATTSQAEADWERRRTQKELEKADRLVAQTERRFREAAERRAAVTPPNTQ